MLLNEPQHQLLRRGAAGDARLYQLLDEQDALRHAHDLAVDLASTGLNISFRNVSPTFVSRDGRPVGLPDTPLGNALPRGFF